MLAKDIMTTEVVTVAPETTVADIADLLLKRNISGVPVIDSDGAVIGMVSEGDLMRRPESNTETRKRSWWLEMWRGSPELAQEYTKSHGQRASDVMTKNVVTVGEETPVAEIARILEEKHIKRVPVLRDDKLAGIVSRANLLRGLATRKATPVALVSKDDQSLQRDVQEALRKEPWADAAFAGATVEDGVVHLWGMAESTDQRKAYEVAAAAVPGVKSVQNHLTSKFPEFYWAE